MFLYCLMLYWHASFYLNGCKAEEMQKLACFFPFERFGCERFVPTVPSVAFIWKIATRALPWTHQRGLCPLWIPPTLRPSGWLSG